MENIATSVRVTPAANALLSDLSSKTGKPKAQIVEEALRDWEDRMFWSEVQRAFRSDPGEVASETALWEPTVGDGFQTGRSGGKKRSAGNRRRANRG